MVKARDLWFKIITSQIETGTPYMLYKDACNKKSNHRHLGTIQCSNLCTEIIEYTSEEEIAVCNLASISLPKFIEDGAINYERLRQIAYNVTLNINRVIDENFYALKEAKTSNLRHRPIGIGVQGLADLFFLLRLPFDSDNAKLINRKVFEYIYYGSLQASCNLAKKYGPYESFSGSPTSKGILQFDLWNVTPTLDFDSLRLDIMRYGLRNSLLVAPMPTASTSQILGNNECFEPITSNIYTRRVIAGEFTLINKYLIDDLTNLNLWNVEMKDKIIENRGSVQSIESITKDIKYLYRTVWELSMRDLVDMSADRGAFICQSQSFNAFMAIPTKAKLTSYHFYAWKKGLKTGMYYLRTLPAADAIQFTIQKTEKKSDSETCSLKEGCLTCSA